MQPLIISYYTPGTAYEDRAADLRRSIDRLRLEHRIDPRPQKPSWVENCAQKAVYISEVRREVRRPVLWLDADAILRRPLPELDDASCDVAAVKRGGWDIHGGQIYFGEGPVADRLVDRWVSYCTHFPHVWDQVSLGYAWWDVSLEEPVSALWLDEALITKTRRSFTGRLIQRLTSRSAVHHMQESRRSKARQSRPLRQEFASSDVPGWWRAAAAANQPFPLDGKQREQLGVMPTARASAP